MKNIFVIFALTAVFSFSCEDKPDYLEMKGPFASYYPNSSAIVLEANSEDVTIVVQSTGKLMESSNAYIKIPTDGSFITSPAYDPFSKILKLPLTDAEEEGVYRAEFTVTYRDNVTQQEKEIYDLEIVDVDGSLKGVANNVFQFKVIEDDYLVYAPYSEEFNKSCSSDEGFPFGWDQVSRQSDYQWRCSGSNRGFTGEDGDYAIEMSNFGSPDGNGADDWLISPNFDLSDAKDRTLSFSSMLRYQGTTMEVLYSTDYVRGEDPINANWIELTKATDAFDTDTNSFDFVKSGNIDISGLPDKFYIAFRFTSTGASSGETGTARVDNFIIK